MGLKSSGTRSSIRNVNEDSGELPIPSSGVSRYTFDDADTSGSTAIDVWGDNNGTINGATTGVAGANQTYNTNEAYSFDGTDDYLSFSSLPSVFESGTSSFSVSFWINRDSGSSTGNDGRRDILGTVGSGDDNFDVNIRDRDGDGAREVNAYVDDGTDNFLRSSFVPSVGEWNFITVVFGSDKLKIFIDGNKNNEKSVGNSISSTQNSLRIGYGDTSYSDYWAGEIDDVRIYNKALTAQEVSDLYNNGSIVS